MNKKIIVSLAAIVISASIGLPIAITTMGITAENTSPKLMGATLSEISSSNYTSSDTSSAVSSEVSQIVSSTPVSTVTLPVSSSTVSAIAPTTSTPIDRTVEKNADLVTESTRHDKTITDINNQYDTQIAVLQTEIKTLIDGGAKDTTDTITQYWGYYLKQKDYYEHCGSMYPNLNQTQMLCYNTMNENFDYVTSLKKLKSDYDKTLEDQKSIESLKLEKNTVITQEETNHLSKLQEIQIQYS